MGVHVDGPFHVRDFQRLLVSVRILVGAEETAFPDDEGGVLRAETPRGVGRLVEHAERGEVLAGAAVGR